MLQSFSFLNRFEPAPLAVKVQNANYWATRKFPSVLLWGNKENISSYRTLMGLNILSHIKHLEICLDIINGIFFIIFLGFLFLLVFFCASVRIQWEKLTHWDKYIPELVGSSLFSLPSTYLYTFLTICPQTSSFSIRHADNGLIETA